MQSDCAKGDVLVRQLDSPDTGFALRTTASPDQVRFPTREAAVAHASAFARQAGVGAWFDHGPDGLELLRATRKSRQGTGRPQPRVADAGLMDVSGLAQSRLRRSRQDER